MVDVTGLIGQYAHGNEPSHHIPYLYQYAGRPDRTAERVREICRKFYKNAPDGLCGIELTFVIDDLELAFRHERGFIPVSEWNIFLKWVVKL